MKEYIVCLKVSFITPVDISAKTERTAGIVALSEFKKTFKKLTEKLNDVSELEIDIDYIECQED